MCGSEIFIYIDTVGDSFKNMCELTTYTSIAVVICYQGWRNPEWTKCSVQFVSDMY